MSFAINNINKEKLTDFISDCALKENLKEFSKANHKCCKKGLNQEKMKVEFFSVKLNSDNFGSKSSEWKLHSKEENCGNKSKDFSSSSLDRYVSQENEEMKIDQKEENKTEHTYTISEYMGKSDHYFDTMASIKNREEGIADITDRMISETFHDIFNKYPYDINKFENYINKKLSKEKDLAPNYIKCIISSLTKIIHECLEKEFRVERVKERKNSDGVYDFKKTDYETLTEVYSLYDFMSKSLIKQLKFVFNAPLSIFNKTNKLDHQDIDLDMLFRYVFFNTVFNEALTCLFIYSRYKRFESSTLNLAIKKLWEEINKVLTSHILIHKLNEAIKLNGEYPFVNLLNKILKSIDSYKDTNISEVKIGISVCEQENLKKNVLTVDIIQKENSVSSKKSSQFQSLDELYNFIVSSDSNNHTENHENKTTNEEHKKVIKKKTIKKKIEQNSQNQLKLNDKIVDDFKMFIQAVNNNDRAVHKIKPVFTLDWLSNMSK